MWLPRVLMLTFVAPSLRDETLGLSTQLLQTFDFHHINHRALKNKSLQDDVKLKDFQMIQSAKIVIPKQDCSRNFMKAELSGKNLTSLLSEMIWQTLDHHLPNCLNVLMTVNANHSLVQQIIRLSYKSSIPLVVMDLANAQSEELRHLVMNLWVSSAISCRTLLIDAFSGDITDGFRVLEQSRLWEWNAVQVVIVGSRSKTRSILLQKTLRNIPRPLYFSLEDEMLQKLENRNSCDLTEGDSYGQDKKILVYARCLYCNDGQPDVRLVARWSLGSNLSHNLNPFRDENDNLNRHLLRFTSMRRFPYVQYTKDTDAKGTTVTLQDCVDCRVIALLSANMNFSYEVRIPPDEQWGVPIPGGNWSGMVGGIYREDADSTSFLTNNLKRNSVVDHARFYPGEELAIVSMKPQVLPRYLVIFRPFTDDIWLCLLLSITIWGAFLWLFQKIWSQFSRQESMTICSSFFYSWAVFLEDPPRKPPSNVTGQMLVGWWLISCLVITTGYKSGLVANLAVENKAPAINTFKDLVNQEDWSWAMVKKYFTAHVMTYMKGSSDPVMIKLREYIKPVSGIPEGLERVSEGRFSFLHIKSEVTTQIVSYHTDSTGNTPFYISRNGPKVFSPCGWGLRKGAPFGNKIKDLTNRIVEAGLIDYWTQFLVRSRGAEARKEIRQEQEREGGKKKSQNKQVDEGDLGVLTMSHVMGVFLCLLLGYGISLLIFVWERISFRGPASVKVSS